MPEPLLYLESMGAAAIASVLCVLAIAARRQPITAPQFNSTCVLALGLGIVAGKCVLSPNLVWPPVNGLDRLMTIVVPAALGIELAAGFQRVPPKVAWILRLVLAMAIPPILLHGSIYLESSNGYWSAGQAGTALAAGTTLLTAMWALLIWLSRRSSSGVSISLALALATQCAGVAIIMAGYIKGGATAFPLAATLAATTLGGALAGIRPVPAILGIGVVQLFSILSIGCFFGRLSTGCALALLLSPLLCWATEIRQLRSR